MSGTEKNERDPATQGKFSIKIGLEAKSRNTNMSQLVVNYN